MNFLGSHGSEAVANVFGVAALPFWLMWLICGRKRMGPDTYAVMTTIWASLNSVASAIIGIEDVKHHDIGGAVFSFAIIALNIWIIYDAWKRRKDKKKVAQALGAKSRALRDRLVKNLREAQPEGSN